MGFRIARQGSEVAVDASAHLADGATGDTAVAFPGPFSVADPPGAEGWQDLYAYSLPFAADRREEDEAAFWFRETVHWPRPLRPFETMFLQNALVSLSQANHRLYSVPAARGIDFRLLHGYCYLSPACIDDPAVVETRADRFAERAGHYYERWDDLYATWIDDVRALIDKIDAVAIADLPDLVGLGEVHRGGSRGRIHALVSAYHALVDLGVELWAAHFEFLNLGYGAYLDYFAFCRSVLPSITDLDVAKTVAGIEVDAFRPDRELRRLAALAVSLGIGDRFVDGPTAALLHFLRTDLAGQTWLADYVAVQDPWFNYSTGTGFYHDDAVWIDNPEYPLGFVASYVTQLLAGNSFDDVSTLVAAEREVLAADIRLRLSEADAARFDEKLALARTVFHFVENHNFYIEHWGMSLLWRKFRTLSQRFVDAGFWPNVDDFFLLRPEEIDTALWDLLASWANASAARGPRYWPPEVARRAAILDACAASSPPPALGRPPAVITEPFTIMLWGVTSEALARWLDTPRCSTMTGLAASPGVVEGRARVLTSVDELDDVEDGEILVAELTAASWAPVFARIAGTITEHGGMMSHTAIVCREYGLPAVTGVSGALARITTGQLLRIDGAAGTVVLLETSEG
ncbi:MAG: PEP-utilizing enzyme [Acidimicrobiia bacterium]